LIEQHKFTFFGLIQKVNIPKIFGRFILKKKLNNQGLKKRHFWKNPYAMGARISRESYPALDSAPLGAGCIFFKNNAFWKNFMLIFAA